MGMRRTQQPPVDHARQHNIISIEGASGYFAIGINFGPGGSNNMITAALVLLLTVVLLLTHELLPFPMR